MRDPAVIRRRLDRAKAIEPYPGERVDFSQQLYRTKIALAYHGASLPAPAQHARSESTPPATDCTSQTGEAVNPGFEH